MDRLSKKERSRLMAKIKSKSGIETLPVGFRGLYLRKHPNGISGKPDFGNKTRRIALFIDGCFWHGCKRHYRLPKSNIGFWLEKIEGNKRRDRIINRNLKREGWRIIRIWEHQL